MKTKMLSVMIILVACFNIARAQNSYIQIVAEPGLSIFIDGQFKAKTTSDLGGAIIEGLSGGTHKLKIIKEGFSPQEVEISLKEGEVLTYKVKPFVPEIKISQKGKEEQQTIELKTGYLKIQSIPVEMKISIPDLNINYNKSEDEWLAEDIPVGNYPAKFTWKDKQLDATVEIKDNKMTHLFVNLIKSEIEDRSIEDQPSASNQFIPEINAYVTEVKFYEAGYSGLSKNERKYTDRFDGSNTRYIYWELNLKHSQRSERTQFTVEAEWYKITGSLVAEQSYDGYIEPGWTTSYHNNGYGSRSGGFWKPGSYRVELFVDGKRIARKTFEVY